LTMVMVCVSCAPDATGVGVATSDIKTGLVGSARTMAAPEMAAARTRATSAARRTDRDCVITGCLLQECNEAPVMIAAL
jgi:hypothetical protein